jgi:hypothetical protein
VIYCIGYGGDVDSVLLQRIANDPSLTNHPVGAGNQGRHYNAPTSDLNLAFTQGASQMLRIGSSPSPDTPSLQKDSSGRK